MAIHINFSIKYFCKIVELYTKYGLYGEYVYLVPIAYNIQVSSLLFSHPQAHA